MASKLCPFCMKLTEEETCPHCGNNINYAGSPAHLPAGYVVSGKHPYVLGAALGQGGFGITYIALDMVTNERVAIKEYYPTYCSTRANSTIVSAYSAQEEIYEKGKERFLDEAKTLKSLSDLNSIVNVLDFFAGNNTAYLVMEFLEGSSLKAYAAQNGRFPAQSFLEQIQPLMEDLQKMHDRGVIHRDIAPDNIILLPDGQMKLIDFGAARSYVGDKSMTVVVKKGFAPLEQYFSSGSTTSTDVYSLAATIYYCITGTVPMDSARRQSEETPLTSPIALGADITPQQEKALLHALEVQQKARIQSIREFQAALRGDGASGSPEEETESGNQDTQGQTGRNNSALSSLVSRWAEKCKASPLVQKCKASPLVQKCKALTRTQRIAAAAAAAAVLVLIVYLAGANQRKYDLATEYLLKKQYQDASTLFAELGDYEDSSTMYQESLYKWAADLLGQKKYDQAANQFAQLGDYKDSSSRRKDTIFYWAQDLLQKENYTDALNKLAMIPDYSKTAELVNEVHYRQGKSLLDKKKYEKAYQELTKITGQYRDQQSLLHQLVQNWAKEIIDQHDSDEAENFAKVVQLSEADSGYIYELLINKDYYLSGGNFTGYEDLDTREIMLDALVGYFPLKKDLKTLFSKFSYYGAEDFIRDNRALIARLWDTPIIRNILQDNDWNTCIWLLGNWKASNGKYIKFYEKDNDDSIWSNFTLPWVAEPSGTKFWNIASMELSWTNEDNKVLAKVFRFEFVTPDTMNVYCYKNKQTYLVTRSK